MCDVLKRNTTLNSLNLEQNNKLRVMSGGRRQWNDEHGYERLPVVQRGRPEIVNCLYDTSSLQSIVDSNHTCMVDMATGGYTSCSGTRIEKLMKSINSLANAGKKIRYKVVLALNETDCLYNARDFDSLPLELIPRLLELIQLEIGYYGFGKEVVQHETGKKYAKKSDMRINRLYDFVTGSNTQLLFERGSGVERVCDFDPDDTKTRKRRQFGEERDDSDDEDFKPPPGLGKKRGKWHTENGRWKYTRPSPYKLPPRAKSTRNRED